MIDGAAQAPASPVPSKPSRRSFWVGVLVGAMTMAAILTAVSAFRPDRSAAATAFLARNRAANGVVQTPSGLQYRVLTAGSGPRPTDSDVALVTYTGTLIDGTVFDQSRRPTPLPVADVIPGFSEALKLMATGATYRLWIRPELAYGYRPFGPIPAGSVLVFDVTLVKIQAKSAARPVVSQKAAITPQ